MGYETVIMGPFENTWNAVKKPMRLTAGVSLGTLSILSSFGFAMDVIEDGDVKDPRGASIGLPAFGLSSLVLLNNKLRNKIVNSLDYGVSIPKPFPEVTVDTLFPMENPTSEEIAGLTKMEPDKEYSPYLFIT